jgi:uncharacterized protein YjlB
MFGEPPYGFSAMTFLESIKKSVQQATGWQRPSAKELATLVRTRKPATFRLRDDGLVPNHQYWPLVVYRGAVRLPSSLDPAAVFEELFGSNGWGNSWRDAIYNYVHFHSSIHEVLGIARGSAKVRFGGSKGRTLTVKAGDAVILPAGTGHQCLSASNDLLVVGAYPPNGTYDECKATAEEHQRAVKAVRKIARPRKDPIYGAKGPLRDLWKSAR